MRSERGQTAADYLGALLVISVIVAAVATTGVGQRIKAAMASEVECIATGSNDCDDSVTVTEYVEDLMEFYSQFDGDRGALLDELNDPSNDDFSDLVDQRDISVDGGETTRRFFTVEPVPGRGVVAFDFFIPSENSNGFAGDDRPEEGTDILRDDLPLTDSRVMIVMDFETGRGVIVQTETHLDLPGGIDWANEPRPISLNGDRGSWDNMGGIDLDETNQIDLSSNADGMHVDWDILNSISPFAISVDGDVDFEEGADGFLHSDDFGNQGRVDRYPQVQVWQYLPDGQRCERPPPQVRIERTTVPSTSVRRKSRPL